jgi:3-deoxy-D-manno-octulosonic-acid transferase
VVVIGSTRSEYEVELTQKAIIPILTENPHLTVIHAPRHIEAAEEVMNNMKTLIPPDSSISCGFRSKNDMATYLVLDSYGELAGVYNIADIVVIGGGFDKLGGQNLIQPLALGKPVIHGPNMFNFRDIATTSVGAGASMVCNTSLELQHSIESLLSDETQRGTMSQRASELVQKNLGASKRYAEAVLAELD